MPSPSKAKGNSWERSVADFLSNLYGEHFMRVPSSGAYVGGTNTVRKMVMDDGQVRAFKGDIMPGISFPKLNIECKSYKDFPFHQLLTGNIKILETWIDQLLSVANEGDLSLLIMKFNRKGKFILFRGVLTSQIVTTHAFRYESEKHGPWILMDFDLFWKYNKDTVKTLAS